jgi:L-threonylcarbamoyladenylate synthase
MTRWRDDLIQPDSVSVRVQAARLIAGGGVIGYLTDTFYALGANPLNKDAIEKISLLKGRDNNKPILIIISDLEIADRFLATRSVNFCRLAERFYPGELTIVETAKPQVLSRLKSASGAIGLRLPRDSMVLDLVRACGGALTATSANPAGLPPATSASEVALYFPTELDLIVNGGNATQIEPSTIVDVSSGRPRLIREGVIKKSELAKVVELDS